MTRAIDDSKKESYVLVKFTVNSTDYRFTNWGTSIDPAGDNWLSTPTLDVKWPKNTGTLEAKGAIINVNTEANATMSTLVELLLADGTPTAAVDVEIREVIKPVVIGDQATELIPFVGRVLRAVRNANGRNNQVRFEVQSVKARLDIPLGVPCNHHCAWQFMGKGCAVQGGTGVRGPQFGSNSVIVQGLSIDGKELTVNNDPGLTGTKSLRFGYIVKDNVRIGIQDWDPLDPTKIIMRQQAPASWIGVNITLVVGCNKTIEGCRDDHSNESNFGGLGYSLPAYNPMFEDGA
tara:strand:+ start:35510 stop:36382 length:873 start_codon:yes stop_codon:yes gene_type:complete